MARMADEDKALVDAFHAAVRESWSIWFETYARIYDKKNNLISPTSNYLQREIERVVRWLRQNNLPVRLMVLKPRQKGSSTFTTAGLYHDLCESAKNGVIIGGAHFQAKNLYKKVQVYSREDKMDWGVTSDIKEQDGKWSNGSVLERLTAANKEAGRSGTYQWVLGTEVARWAEEGVADAKDVLAGLLKCVPDLDGTTVVLESTAMGASGDFYERWIGAKGFDEYKDAYARGERVSGDYIRVFAPWFEFVDSCHELTPVQQDSLRVSLTEEEERLMAEYQLSLGHISWRRWAIENECQRDPELFKQDYPGNWQEAFLTSGRKRFNSYGLKLLKDGCKTVKPQYGSLRYNEDVQESYWNSEDERDARLHRWEEPRNGYRYLISVDTMTGSSQTSGKDPDCHSCLVLRAGFHEHGRGWVKPMVVCRVVPGCRWDIDILEEQVWRLHRYYRGAMIVPEVNMDRGLIELLKKRGATIYRREMFNRRENKVTEALGWQTNPATREMAIDNLARAIREWDRDGEGVDILCPHIVKELENFVVKESGRSEAESGHHDDDVLALAIGMSTLGDAVRYVPVVRERILPPDLRRLEDKGRRQRSQYS